MMAGGDGRVKLRLDNLKQWIGGGIELKYSVVA